MEGHPNHVNYGYVIIQYSGKLLNLTMNFRLKLKRKVWSVPYCLAIKDKPHFANFTKAFEESMSGIVTKTDTSYHGDSFKTQCFPLYTLLKSLNNPTVNMLSLDIEGAEFEVGLEIAMINLGPRFRN